MRVIPSSSLGRAATVIPSRALSHAPTVIPSRALALYWDEEDHPRDEHGRFGNKAGGVVSGGPGDTGGIKPDGHDIDAIPVYVAETAVRNGPGPGPAIKIVENPTTKAEYRAGQAVALQAANYVREAQGLPLLTQAQVDAGEGSVDVRAGSPPDAPGSSGSNITTEGVPVVWLGENMQDTFTLIHECTHLSFGAAHATVGHSEGFRDRFLELLDKHLPEQGAVLRDAFAHERFQGDKPAGIRWSGRAAALRAAGDFDEAKHPRDSHGRFGEGGSEQSPNEALLTAVRADAKPVYTEMFQTGEKMHGLVGVPNGEPDVTMAASLKAGVAHDVAGNMKSSTEDICAAAGVNETALGNHDVIVWMETENGHNVGVNWDNMPPHPSDVEQIDKTGRLDGNPVFRGDTPEAAALLREDAVGKLVSLWAGTSNDSSAQSLAMQDSAIAEFGLKGTAPWTPWDAGGDSPQDLIAQHGDVYRDFLRSQYESTQGYLKGEGITELTVARGWSWGLDEDPPMPAWAVGKGVTAATVETRPMSSWTTRGITAASFATKSPQSALTYQRVPAERILSIPLTGLGCLPEREVVVLGGTDEVVVSKHARVVAAAGPMATVRPYDDATRNEDWIKTLSWDLPTDPARFRPGELATLEGLPAGEAMPAALRKTLVASGGDFDESKHPRDSHGRFGEGDSSDSSSVTVAGNTIPLTGRPDGKGTATDPIYTDGDLDRAIELLGDGKHVRLDTEKQAGTLVAQLGVYAKELHDKGERAGNFDLCGVSVAGSNIFCEGNLGVPRIEMPQLRGQAVDGSPAAELRKDPADSSESVSIEDKFTQALRDSDVPVNDVKVDAEMLRPTQSEINGAQAGYLLQKMLAGTFSQGPIWTTSDGYILDGHHRYVAEVAKNLLEGGDGHVMVDAHEVGMEIGAAIDATNAFAREQGIKQKSALVAAGDFDEDKHPRDSRGRFGDKDAADKERDRQLDKETAEWLKRAEAERAEKQRLIAERDKQYAKERADAKAKAKIEGPDRTDFKPYGSGYGLSADDSRVLAGAATPNGPWTPELEQTALDARAAVADTERGSELIAQYGRWEGGYYQDIAGGGVEIITGRVAINYEDNHDYRPEASLLMAAITSSEPIDGSLVRGLMLSPAGVPKVGELIAEPISSWSRDPSVAGLVMDMRSDVRGYADKPYGPPPSMTTATERVLLMVDNPKAFPVSALAPLDKDGHYASPGVVTSQEYLSGGTFTVERVEQTTMPRGGETNDHEWKAGIAGGTMYEEGRTLPVEDQPVTVVHVRQTATYASNGEVAPR